MKKTHLIFLIVLLIAVVFGVSLFRPRANSQAQKVEVAKLPEQAVVVSTKQEMVLVPAGSFQMGFDAFSNAKPVHKVTLTHDFYMGKYEVTNQQYADMLNYALSKGYLDKKFLSVSKVEARGAGAGTPKYQDVADEHSQISFADGVFKPHAGKENTPVVEVTWAGAAFYCNMLSVQEGLTPLYNQEDWTCQVYGKAGYRLPTEAEWEYAAKYNDARKFPWGDQEPDNTYANIGKTVKDPTDVLTTSVGEFSPKGDNALGISDLTGNVSEWCNDWYNDRYLGGDNEIDPVGPLPSLFVNLPPFKEFRPMNVLRGGSFLLDAEYRKEMGPPFVMDCVIHPEVYNNSFRSFDYKGLSRQVQGFRVVKISAGKK
jgi:formylglycine-generating enzyme required for sulfatase activity